MDLVTAKTLEGVPERRVTRWHNPTRDVQRVVINEGPGQRFLFTVNPGETKELDSKYDRLIQMVDCGRDECHHSVRKGAGWFCTQGHDGMIVGGMAPLLKRVGANDTIDDSLDPVASARKAMERKIDEELQRDKILEEGRQRRQMELDAATAAAQAQARAQDKGGQSTKGAGQK